MKKQYHFVLTGGPSGGKTSSLLPLKEHFENIGYEVILVPEVASMFFSAGLHRPKSSEEKINLQLLITKMQLRLEGYIKEGVSKHPHQIFFYDRGLLDCKAYLEEAQWEHICSKVDLSEEQMISRYHAIFHMVTAADGAEAYYSSDNNPVRLESLFDALSLDQKTMEAWEEHPCQKIIYNESNNFSQKLERLKKEITLCLEKHG